MIVAVPADTPDTTPVEALTVAMLVLEELYEPPLVAEVNVVVAPAHTVAVPVRGSTVGSAFTVTVLVTDVEHPFSVTV